MLTESATAAGSAAAASASTGAGGWTLRLVQDNCRHVRTRTATGSTNPSAVNCCLPDALATKAWNADGIHYGRWLCGRGLRVHGGRSLVPPSAAGQRSACPQSDGVGSAKGRSGARCARRHSDTVMVGERATQMCTRSHTLTTRGLSSPG